MAISTAETINPAVKAQIIPTRARWPAISRRVVHELTFSLRLSNRLVAARTAFTNGSSTSSLPVMVSVILVVFEKPLPQGGGAGLRLAIKPSIDAHLTRSEEHTS